MPSNVMCLISLVDVIARSRAQLQKHRADRADKKSQQPNQYWASLDACMCVGVHPLLIGGSSTTLATRGTFRLGGSTVAIGVSKALNDVQGRNEAEFKAADGVTSINLYKELL